MGITQQIGAEEADFFLVDESLESASELISDLKGLEPAKALLDGSRSSTKAELMEEAYVQLDFPSYFGRNWDALNDSLAEKLWCLENCNTYLLIFTNSDKLLSQETEEEIDNLLEIMKAAVDGLTTGKRTLALKVIFLIKDVMNSRIGTGMTNKDLDYKVIDKTT
ncbi:MAG: barstar family protein [Synechococcus sp.]